MTIETLHQKQTSPRREFTPNAPRMNPTPEFGRKTTSAESQTDPIAESTGIDPVNIYLREIGQFPVYSAEEETAAAKRLRRAQVSAHILKQTGEILGGDVESKFGKRSVFSNPHNINRDPENHTIYKAKMEKRAARFLDAYSKMDPPRWQKTVKKLKENIKEAVPYFEDFVRHNLKLVVPFVREYQGRGLPHLELIQEGNLGIMQALARFDVRKGFKFSTYAVWWVRQTVQRALDEQSETIRVPVHVHNMMRKIRKVEIELTQKLGRTPTDEEIAFCAGEDPNDITRAKLVNNPASLNELLSEESKKEYGDLFASADCTEDEAIGNTLKDEVNEILKIVNQRERDILEKRFGLNGRRAMSLVEVGREYNLTRERIRQIEAKALGKLRCSEEARKKLTLIS